MKKLFASMTALALVGAMMVPMAAFAESVITGPNTTGTATAVGEVAGTYTVTIPSQVNIGGTPEEVTVTATNCYVTVTAVAAGNGAVYNTPAQTGDPVSGAAFTVVTRELTNLHGENPQFGIVSAEWDTAPTAMGTYYGTIEFSVEARANTTV